MRVANRKSLCPTVGSPEMVSHEDTNPSLQSPDYHPQISRVPPADFPSTARRFPKHHTQNSRVPPADFPSEKQTAISGVVAFCVRVVLMRQSLHILTNHEASVKCAFCVAMCLLIFALFSMFFPTSAIATGVTLVTSLSGSQVTIAVRIAVYN